MDITITINTDNEAFGYHCEREVQRILTEFVARIGRVSLERGDEVNLRDINGNTVGKVVVK